MKYEDVIQLWGRNLLRKHGYKVSDTESVYVSLGYENMGFCETCEYTEGTVEVRANRCSITVVGYEFAQILNDLVALSAENADKITK